MDRVSVIRKLAMDEGLPSENFSFRDSHLNYIYSNNSNANSANKDITMFT